MGSVKCPMYYDSAGFVYRHVLIHALQLFKSLLFEIFNVLRFFMIFQLRTLIFFSFSPFILAD